MLCLLCLLLIWKHALDGSDKCKTQKHHIWSDENFAAGRAAGGGAGDRAGGGGARARAAGGGAGNSPVP